VLLLSTDKKLSVAGSTSYPGRGVDSLDDESDLSLSSLVLDVLIIQVGYDLRSGFFVSVNEEPSRRSGK